VYSRRRDVEDARCSTLFLCTPQLCARLLHDGIPLTTRVGLLLVHGLAVEAHVDSDGDGELEVLRVVLGAAMVLVPGGISDCVVVCVG
jgi:hypothetical protein